jgi:hypothetical protein
MQMHVVCTPLGLVKAEIWCLSLKKKTCLRQPTLMVEPDITRLTSSGFNSEGAIRGAHARIQGSVVHGQHFVHFVRGGQVWPWTEHCSCHHHCPFVAESLSGKDISMKGTLCLSRCICGRRACSQAKGAASPAPVRLALYSQLPVQ